MKGLNLILKIIKRVTYELDKYKLKQISLTLHSVGEDFIVDKPYEIGNPQNITIGHSFHTSHNLRLHTITDYENETFSPHLTIGNNVFINSYCHIACADNITIGDSVLIASKVYISDHSHGKADASSIEISPIKRKLITLPIQIGNNVWIGEGVSILMGVSIGDNSIIGANAMVNKSFPPNSVIGGIPAKLIRSIQC